jgi:hypothetical protein
LSQGNGPGDNQDNGFGPDFGPGFTSDGSEGLQLPPWERRERFGLLNGLYLTIKDVLFTPRQFFHRMPSQVGLLSPLLFAILIGVVGAFFDWMWSLAGSSLEMFLNEDIEDVIRGPIGFFFNFIMSPVTVGVAVFLKAGIIHLCLMLFGGNRLGFEATFRVAAYSQAAGILSLFPFCGGPVGVLWGLLILIIGLYSIHETDPWKAVAAVVLPMVLCLTLVGSSLVTLLLSLT